MLRWRTKVKERGVSVSTDCTGYIGYTVTLKRDLDSSDFAFFDDFDDAHSEYSMWEHKGATESVRLVVDGMNGNFARFVFVDEKIEDCWIDSKNYIVLRSQSIPDDVYKQLNRAYRLMYNKDLDKSSVEYALWFLFG